MKKIFAFSVFLLFVVVANAQFADTTTLRIGGKSSSGWMRIYGSFAPWQSNDTLTGLEVGGLRYVRVFKNSQLFTTQELNIYADGTDYTNRLNYVLSKPFVKGVIFDENNGDSIRIDGTVEQNNKRFVFNGSLFIGGTGTLNNPFIDAPNGVKVFGLGIELTGNVMVASDYFSVSWFGAKGDDSNDDTKAIQKAFDVANTTVLFPTGVYKTTDSLVLNYTSKLNMPSGSLIKSYTTSVPAVIIGYPHGTPPSTVRNMSYSVRVQRATQSDWTNRNSIGVLLRNLNYCKIDHIEASNFTVGAKALAKNGGFSYVDYQLGLFLNNEIGLWIDEETSGPTAWNNQNNYYGGWFRANSSINVSKQRWGVVIGHEGGYRHTNNVFLGTDFELINAAAVPVLVNAGSRNVFRDYRSEGNSDTSAKVISGNRNMFYPAKCSESDTLVDLSSFASNMLECLEKTPRNKINYSPIISVDNLTNYTQYSGNDTSINIRGNLSFISREAKLVVIKTRKGITRTDNGLSFGADFPGGITTDIFNTSSLKKYMLRYSATGGAATLLIKSYNEDGVLLRDGLHVANTYTSTPTYTSTYGGAWIIGNVVPGEILLTAEDTVKSMQIIVGMGNSSSTIGIQSFKLFTYGEGTTDAGFFRQSPTDFLNTSPTAPVYGSYHRGEIILNDNPKKDSVWAWVCTSSGTFGNLSGVTGSGSNTSIKLVLSDASSVNVKEWLLVNNKPNIVTGKWGDTVYLSNPLTSTISGVSINYATPTFEPIAYVGATGGSMPGWVLDTLTAHNNRLSNVEQNDTINVTFEKNAGKDSIVLTIEGKRMAVEDASGVGGGSGTVNSGAANRLAYYPSSGTTVDDLAAITASRALASDANGLPVASTTTATELSYLSGVSSEIQTQLNAKQATLVSGTNIKTVDGQSIVGSGDVDVTVAKNSTRDSIIITIGSNRYAVKDSIGSAGGSVDFITPTELDTLFAQNNIAAWGNSLTFGYPAYPYPETLSRLTGRYIYNGGVSGETSTQIKTRMIADTAKFNWPVIIWAGRNNYNDSTAVVNDIATMIDSLKHDKYIVMGILNGEYAAEYSGGASYSKIINLNNYLSSTYGSRFVPIRTYLTSLNTGVGQDATDATHDIVPASLRADAIHLNKAGYDTVARYIYDNYMQFLTYDNDKAISADDARDMHNGNLSGSFTNLLAVRNSSKEDVFKVTPGDVSTATIYTMEDTSVIGSNIVANGTFASGASWTSTGWTISGNKAQHNTGNTNALTQSISMNFGWVYEVSVTILDRTTSYCTISIGSESISNSSRAASNNFFSANQTYTTSVYWTATSGSYTLSITPMSTFNGSVTNISVKRVTPVLRNSLSFHGANTDFGLKPFKTNLVLGGLEPMTHITSGLGNVGFGAYSFEKITGGSYNVGIGYQALRYTLYGSSNVGIGSSVLLGSRNSYNNIAIGDGALTIGDRLLANTAIGYQAMGKSGNFSSENTAIGNVAGHGTTNMFVIRNTLIGSRAGYGLQNGGDYNTIVGAYSGENVGGGDKNIVLGYDIDLPIDGGSNQLNIGNAIFGTGVNQSGTTMGGKIGIKVKTPQADFHVGGNIKIDTIPTGTPGTDSVLVVNNGVVKRIPANYYSTGTYINNKVAYIDDANYTFADSISAAVLNNSTAKRTFTLPSEVTYHGRTITVRNDTNDSLFLSTGFVYNKTWGSGVLEAHRWVTATADRNYGWIVIAQGGTSSNSTGWYVPSISSVQTLDSATPDTFYYTKNAELIHVWGRATVVTKSSDSFTSQPVDITLPFAWDALDGAMFTDDGQLLGFATVDKSGTKQFTDVLPNTVNNKAKLSFTKTASTSETFNLRIDFNYRVFGNLVGQ